MTSTVSHVAVGVAVVAIFAAGTLEMHPRLRFTSNLAASIALAVAAAMLVTAARVFG